MGLTGNGFIIAVNFYDWVRSRDINTSNFIISWLGVSNFILQGTLLVSACFYLLQRDMYYIEPLRKTLIIFRYSLLSSSLWFSTWLCLYYCLKILSCSQPFFVLLRVRFPKLVAPMLLGSTLVSLVISLPMAWDFYQISSTNATDAAGNSPAHWIYNSSCSCTFYIYVVVSSLAFVILSSSAVVLIVSLFRHMKRMEQNMSSLRNLRLEAHQAAAKTVLFLLLFSFSHYLSQMLLILYVIKPNTDSYTLFYLVVTFFPTLNSIILVQGSASLKKALNRFLLRTKCYCCCRE
ncbi:taste receptor type 2 member 40-like [Microcaecilia unicolor]|uniref:Taste receptor type 2 n=1 Tax=Microcaecilia unicolor TaxID=1415580 RepID=A0A6P7WNS9_9AMPH|nr:taste receptor type 2 member 40-like [Microcaecilia unicolor]